MPIEEMSWLMSYAVRLEYLDNGNAFGCINVIWFKTNLRKLYFLAEEYASITSKNLSKTERPVQPRVSSQDPIDNLDTESEIFKTCIKNLANQLSIGDHPDHVLLLQAISRFINERLRPEALAEQLPTGISYPIKEEGKCAFDDQDIDQAAKILRLLQVHNVRALQTLINETIVVVQHLTADPKTDTKLGKVGF